MNAKEAVKMFNDKISTIRAQHPECDIFVNAATKLGVEIISKTIQERRQIEAEIRHCVDSPFQYDCSVNGINGGMNHKSYIQQVYLF